ncbi:MAG: sigma-70 family RNA polymerase sigma factor [Cephaloticoccus sp.]
MTEGTTSQPGAAGAEDAALLHRMATGDREAFGALYDRFSRPLFSTALQILRDSAEAEDVIQDVFLTLWEKSAEFSDRRGSAFAWAVTLTRNRAIDRIRMRRRRGELLARAAPDDLGALVSDALPDSADHLAAKEHASGVRAAVAELPPGQQEALRLAFFSGLTQQEIAARLQQPLGTIKARIRRGLMKLREKLEPRA